MHRLINFYADADRWILTIPRISNVKYLMFGLTIIPTASQSSSYLTPPAKDSTRPRRCQWPHCPCTLPSWSTTFLGLWSPQKAKGARCGRLWDPDSPTAKGRKVTRVNAVRESWLSSLTETEQGNNRRTERVENMMNEMENIIGVFCSPYLQHGVQQME